MKITSVKQSSRNIIIEPCFEKEQPMIKSIAQQQAHGFFTGKLASCAFIQDANQYYLAVGLGKRDKLNITLLRKAINAAYKKLEQLKASDLAFNLNTVGEKHSRSIIEAFLNANYKFNQLKSSDYEDYQLNSLEIISSQNLDETIKTAQAVASGQNYAKDLKNYPANVCSTQYMFDEAKKLMDEHDNCTFSALNEKEMLDKGMGCITAVGQGSQMPTYIAAMEYYGAKDKNSKPIVLVGKGMVYDTGGLCLKPANGMGTMKMDMGGAAAVYGTMKAIVELQLPINVIGVAALVENSIDSKSYRPGDVLTSMKGITVEVGNTDAEGRLALCDTLTYIDKYNPKAVIDIATLTGAIVISLGSDLTGLFANDQSLADALIKAGKDSHDQAWQMPLHQNYMESLKSDVADTNNIGNKGAAGSITAALFLSKFTEKYKWAHLDVAGSAMGNFNKAIASGRPVPLLTQYIIDQC